MVICTARVPAFPYSRQARDESAITLVKNEHWNRFAQVYRIPGLSPVQRLMRSVLSLL